MNLRARPRGLGVLVRGVSRVMRLGTVLFFVIPVLSSLGQQSGNAKITLMLIDANSGKPLTKVPVTAEWWNDSPSGPPDHPFPSGPIKTATDKNGQISFLLPHPLPRYVGFLGINAPNFWRCTPFVFPVQDVLASGVVAPFTEGRTGCGRLPPVRKTAAPGEIVIYQRPFTRWDWLRQETP